MNGKRLKPIVVTICNHMYWVVNSVCAMLGTLNPMN